MTEILLDGNAIQDGQQLHSWLADKLNFPFWYGGNLDALYDCLTEMPGEVRLTIVNDDRLRAALGAYGDKFLQVFCQAAKDNPRFHLGLSEELRGAADGFICM